MPDTAGCSSLTEHFPTRGRSDSTQPGALCSSEIQCKNICQLFRGQDYPSGKIGSGLITQLTTLKVVPDINTLTCSTDYKVNIHRITAETPYMIINKSTFQAYNVEDI